MREPHQNDRELAQALHLLPGTGFFVVLPVRLQLQVDHEECGQHLPQHEIRLLDVEGDLVADFQKALRADRSRAGEPDGQKDADHANDLVRAPLTYGLVLAIVMLWWIEVQHADLQEGHGCPQQQERRAPSCCSVTTAQDKPRKKGCGRQVHLCDDLHAARVKGAEGLQGEYLCAAEGGRDGQDAECPPEVQALEHTRSALKEASQCHAEANGQHVLGADDQWRTHLATLRSPGNREALRDVKRNEEECEPDQLPVLPSSPVPLRRDRHEAGQICRRGGTSVVGQAF
mmetsp:Transcript_130054/g.277781  ORF Transcript_130054/g.277781 Transcript_130054/m.277781 type:complete len:287 (-) Transcript_130054:260-1120(-)